MDLIATKEISETRGGESHTHRVGPLAGLCAVIFWGSALAFIISTVAFGTTYWVKIGSIHQGLWKACAGDICAKITGAAGWFKTIQALVTLSFIASLMSFALGIIYTFIHFINKSIVLLLVIILSALAAAFMVIGAIYLIAKVERDFGTSFFLGWVGGVLDIVVAVVAFIQKKQSEA